MNRKVIKNWSAYSISKMDMIEEQIDATAFEGVFADTAISDQERSVKYLPGTADASASAMKP